MNDDANISATKIKIYKKILAKLRISVKSLYRCVRMCVNGANPTTLPLCLMLLRLITEAAHARAMLCISKYNFKCFAIVSIYVL